jgi:excisionase family DNA binding protein
VADDAELPELPFEITVGVISMIHQNWWDENPEALQEAEQVAAWLDFHIERRNVGPVIEQPVQRLTMTVEEAAQVLGISRATAYEAVGRGEIPCIRIGKRILIPKAALEKMVNG